MLSLPSNVSDATKQYQLKTCNFWFNSCSNFIICARYHGVSCLNLSFVVLFLNLSFTPGDCSSHWQFQTHLPYIIAKTIFELRVLRQMERKQIFDLSLKIFYWYSPVTVQGNIFFLLSLIIPLLQISHTVHAISHTVHAVKLFCKRDSDIPTEIY